MEKEKNDFAANDELGADPAIEDMAGELPRRDSGGLRVRRRANSSQRRVEEEEVPPTDRLL